MRSRSLWMEFLQSMRKNLPRQVAITVQDYCSVELGLFFLHRCRPEMPASHLWFVLAGYLFPGGWNHEQAAWASVLRYYLTFYQGPYEWKRALKSYQELPEDIRSYTLDEEGRPVLLSQPPAGPERMDAYHTILTTPPPYHVRKNKTAKKGRYVYSIRRSGRNSADHSHKEEVIFDTLPQFPPLPAHQLQTKLKPRAPLTVALDDLVATAQWMDEELQRRQAKPEFWEQRMKRIRLETCQQGQTALSPTLIINRLYHMCGMISSGKSTFMDVLAVHLARTNRRTTVVVSDVMSVLERVALYRQLGLEAVPILGQGERSAHLQRFYGGQIPEQILHGTGTAHGAERYLDIGCALMKVNRNWQDGPPNPEDYPCWQLEPVYKKTPYKAAAKNKIPPLWCPLRAGCSVHRAQHEAATASIWVTTPAGLLHVGVHPEVNAEAIRWAELAVRTHDLIIIDEADRVQRDMDNIFNPTLILSGETSFLNAINESLPMGSKHDFAAMADKEMGYWLQTYETIRTVMRRFQALLLIEPFLSAWLLKKGHFTDLSLFAAIFNEMFPKKEFSPEEKRQKIIAAMYAEVWKFLDDPLGETNPGGGDQLPPLVALANASVNLTGDPGRTTLQQGIDNWLNQWLGRWDEGDGNRQKKETDKWRQLIVSMELAILTTVFQNRLNRLLRQWPYVEKYFPSNTKPPFNSILEDYTGIVPAEPMGNIMALHYSKSEHQNPGTLRLIRCQGVGRWLLQNLSALLVGETFAGAHTLLLSGTSWAGNSSTFHIQTPVDGVLCAPDAEVAAIRESVFSFCPMYSEDSSEPIRISGVGEMNERARKLEELCDVMDGWLEQTLNGLPEGRRKMLLLTNSYDEAELVAQRLSGKRWKERVRYLVRDEVSPDPSRKGALQRGRIAEFGLSPEPLLVAPLAAVERGHNILNAQRVAAIGAAAFLVRPHPPAEDLEFPLLVINHMAMEFIRSAPGQAFSPEWSPEAFRREAYHRWCELLRESLSYSQLSDEDRPNFIWRQIVALWQTIGRLIRGGQRAEVYFLDAAFAPYTARRDGSRDTVETSLLEGMRQELALHFAFQPESDEDKEEWKLIRHLYEPFYLALRDIRGLPPMDEKALAEEREKRKRNGEEGFGADGITGVPPAVPEHDVGVVPV